MFRQSKVKDKRNRRRDHTENEEQSSNCIICLDTVSCRGRLGVCKHWFCFHCIFEWSKNTNTCPICKARFRCITKIHLNTLKSPPKKVRVRDIDQRVWNEDDDIVADDLIDLAEDSIRDDFDDDYEPPTHVRHPWTQARQNNRRVSAFDEYDMDDTFINDGDELTSVQDDGGDETSEECMLPRESPYLLRCNGAGNISLSSRILEVVHGDCPNTEQSSPGSIGSFIVSENSLSDRDADQWMPPENHTHNSRRRSGHPQPHKKQTMKRKTQTTMQKSQSAVGNQVSTRSRCVQKADDTSEDALSDSGWINMNTRRENMKTSRSLAPSRRGSKRRSSRKTKQGVARHMASDSEQTDYNIPSSSRPNRNKKRKPRGSSSNQQVESLSTASHCRSRTGKRLKISSGESDESDSDDFMSANNKCLKGKGKGFGKKPLSRQSHGSLTRKIHITSSEDSDESDSNNLRMPLSSRLGTKPRQPHKGHKVTKSSTETRSTRVFYQGNSGNSQLQGEKDTAGDMTQNINKKAKIVLKSSLAVRINDWNKENEGCKKERNLSSASTTGASNDETGMIAPSPQLRRYHSIFTKRCHRSPTYTFGDSWNNDTKVNAHSQLPHKTTKMEGGKSSKLAEEENNMFCKTDSPIQATKRRRLQYTAVDSDSD